MSKLKYRISPFQPDSLVVHITGPSKYSFLVRRKEWANSGPKPRQETNEDFLERANKEAREQQGSMQTLQTLCDEDNRKRAGVMSA